MAPSAHPRRGLRPSPPEVPADNEAGAPGQTAGARKGDAPGLAWTSRAEDWLLRSRLGVFTAVGLIEVGFLALVGSLTSSLIMLGVPGSGVALLVMVAAILAGSLVGLGVALVGGLAFWVFIFDFGRVGAPLGVLLGFGIWCFAAVVAGRLAASLRVQRRHGRRVSQRLARERSLRAATDRLLEHSLALGSGDLAAVAAQVCHATRTVLGCAWSRLYVVEEDRLRLVASEPAAGTLRPGASYALREASDELLRRRHAVATTELDALGLPAELTRAVRELGAGTALLAPLLVGERLTGLLAGTWRSDGPELDAALLGVAQRLADQASAALEDARRRAAQDELNELHDTLERSLLPPLPRTSRHRLRVLTRYVPGEGRLRLGGDFLDLMELRDGGLALVIGDVTGHGPAAAALGATLRASWQSLVAAGADPVTLGGALETTLLRERRGEDTLATACLARIERQVDGDRLHCLSIGHPPPVLLAGEAQVLPLTPRLPLGVGGDRRPAPVDVALKPPWTLLFYTDGLIEGRLTPGAPQRLGEHGLLAMLQEDSRLDEAHLDRLLEAVTAGDGGRAHDDVALIVVSRAE